MYKFALNSYTWAIHLEFEPDLTKDITKKLILVLKWRYLRLHIQIRSNKTLIWSVYEVKWVVFKLIFCHLKLLACPWPLLCSIPCVRAFKWGNVWHSTSRGIKTTKSLSLKIPKSLLLLCKVESLNLKVVAVLMPLEINHQTIPNLKALTHGIEHTSRHGLGRTLKQ